jgi:hypothetical protein
LLSARVCTQVAEAQLPDGANLLLVTLWVSLVAIERWKDWSNFSKSKLLLLWSILSEWCFIPNHEVINQTVAFVLPNSALWCVFRFSICFVVP